MERTRSRNNSLFENGYSGGDFLLPKYRPQGASLKHSPATRRTSHKHRFNRLKSLIRFLLAACCISFSIQITSSLFAGNFTLPFVGEASPVQQFKFSDLLYLNGDKEAARKYIPASNKNSIPKLIPRIIHQTYKSRAVPDAIRQYMHTWKDQNSGWELRFYDDGDCYDFVRREFPEYLDAYRKLSKDIERSDFFRYMVVLRYGGVYADIDTECKRPLDDIVQSRDTLVVGWENEFPLPKAAVDAWYVRTRQILQWVFVGAPGHPALREICDRIAQTTSDTFSLDSNIDTLERTGPGMFTDVILKHAVHLHPPRNRDDPWTVRILPRITFGSPSKAAYGVHPDDPSIAVQHHFLGSWKFTRQWWQHWIFAWKTFIARNTVESSNKNDKRTDDGSTLNEKDIALSQQRTDNGINRFDGTSTSHASKSKAASSVDGAHHRSNDALRAQLDALHRLHDVGRLYPVSADFDPPFDVMTHLMTHGDHQSGWDVSYALTTHGTWQPSVQPHRRPSLADVLVGSLGDSASYMPTTLDEIDRSKEAGSRGSDGGGGGGGGVDEERITKRRQPGVFVDVGAGYGFFTLAAASRGHTVHSFEVGQKSVAALHASVAHNGFQHLITVHKVPLGNLTQEGSLICVEPRYLDKTVDSSGSGVEKRRRRSSSGLAAQAPSKPSNSSSNSSSLLAAESTKTTRTRLLPSKSSSASKDKSSMSIPVEIQRGYSTPSMHDTTSPDACDRALVRRSGAAIMLPLLGQQHTDMNTTAAINETSTAIKDIAEQQRLVDAIRISANGWELAILQGFLPLIQQHRPPVIAIEWNPSAMKQAGYEESPLGMLETLYALGYTDVSHSGYICDERWYAITYGVRRRGGANPEELAGLKQPTWCRLSKEERHLLSERANSKYPETVLLVNKEAGTLRRNAVGMVANGKRSGMDLTTIENVTGDGDGTSSAVVTAIGVQSMVGGGDNGTARSANDSTLDNNNNNNQQQQQQQQQQHDHSGVVENSAAQAVSYLNANNG